MHQTRKLRPTISSTDRLALCALAAAAAACLALAATRVGHAISFAAPLQLVTSGAEQDALASIWRGAHGQAVYTDPQAVPFTASYFNWLFYALYGGAVRLLPCGDAWLPTVCRLLTLGLTCAGAAFLAGSLRREEHLSALSAGTLAVLAFFNPLAGFWIVTARPDAGAAALELGALTIFLRYRETERRSDLLLVALLIEAAWAFKPTAVGTALGIVLAMLARRKREGTAKRIELLLLIALVAGGALLACAWLGPVYRHELFFSQAHAGFSWSWAARHFGAALLKMPFIAVALAGAILFWRRSDGPLRAVSCVLAATFLVELPASSKGGAGDYYFLSLGVDSVAWIGLALTRFRGRALGRSLAVAALLQMIAIASVFLGARGVLDPRDPAQPYEHLARDLAICPGPVFVRDSYGDLPWISPTAPHFVVGYNEEVDRPAGVPFEAGGWPGLLARGYFSTVVTSRAHDLPAAMLRRYRLAREEAGWRFFERK